MPITCVSVRSSRASRRNDVGPLVVAGAPATSVGDRALIESPLLALFCSVKCPGELILKLFDLAKELGDRGVGVVSGFHAPMDKECLDILLRGKGPIVWCPARSIEKMRLGPKYKQAIEAGRLLLLSPFPVGQRRMTEDKALVRNRLVVALAERVFVAYAEPGGKTEALCQEAVAAGKLLLTFDSRYNQNLLALGARAIDPNRDL